MSTTTGSRVLLTGHGPLDDRGRLLHEDDLAAQLALAEVRLEEALGRSGLSPADLVRLTVRTTDVAAVRGALDVLTERLDAVGAGPVLTVDAVGRLPVAGMLVALDAVADPNPRPRRTHPSPHRRKNP